ncbi:DUF943 family protein [Scandinavium sp. NPDC088450]|uniref:DUF943 family protein n=1 Tax=Scandinavium sp. NPDC088450 TaxID=3364514 RepID=UPI00384EA29F
MKKTTRTALFIYLSFSLYNLWSLRPVNILYVDLISWSDAGSHANHITVVVDHFPWTDRDRIAWFLAHESEIRAWHPDFKDRVDGIFIMIASEGFLNRLEYPHEDLYCFSSIKNPKNCIEKDVPLRISHDSDSPVIFELEEANYLYNNGKIEVAPDYYLIHRDYQE